MKWLQNLTGGLIGAITLNLLHEAGKRWVTNAPRIDEVGEQAFSKTLLKLGAVPPVGKKLFLATLGADLGTNTLYYSLIGQVRTKYLLLLGGTLGVAAGVGALQVTEKLDLDDEPITNTTTSKVMTVGLYLAGGLAAACAIRFIRNATK